jgi:hypothetical protein
MSTNHTNGHTRRARALVAVLAALAVAPAAQAQPIDPGYDSPAPVNSVYERPAPANVTPAPPGDTVVVHDGAFDWSDAAVGAAAAGGLVALLGAATLTRTRTRTPDQAPFGAR